MLIEQIDNVRPESFQRSFSNLLYVLWPAVHTDGPTTLRIQFETKLRGDHHLLAKRSQAFAHEFLVRERAINFGGVEKCDAVFHSCAKQRDHLRLIFRRAVPKAHPHAPESDRRNFQPALSKFALFHSVTSKKCVCYYGLTITLIAFRSFIARYPSGTPSRPTVRSNTRPGSIL